jgi:hypothetical protein
MRGKARRGEYFAISGPTLVARLVKQLALELSDKSYFDRPRFGSSIAGCKVAGWGTNKSTAGPAMRKVLPEKMFNDADQSRLGGLRTWVLDNK